MAARVEAALRKMAEDVAEILLSVGQRPEQAGDIFEMYDFLFGERRGLAIRYKETKEWEAKWLNSLWTGRSVEGRTGPVEPAPVPCATLRNRAKGRVSSLA